MFAQKTATKVYVMWDVVNQLHIYISSDVGGSLAPAAFFEERASATHSDSDVRLAAKCYSVLTIAVTDDSSLRACAERLTLH